MAGGLGRGVHCPGSTSRWHGLCPSRLSLPTLLQDTAGEPLYKLFKAIKHQVEKGPVDAVQKKAKYTLNDTGLLGDDVEYTPLVRARPAVGSSEAGLRTSAGCSPPPCMGPPALRAGPRDIPVASPGDRL